MAKEVTLKNLNKAYVKELFSSKIFWAGLVLYAIGLVYLKFNILNGAIIMLVAALIMISVDWQGRKEVVKRLSWK